MSPTCGHCGDPIEASEKLYEWKGHRYHPTCAAKVFPVATRPTGVAWRNDLQVAPSNASVVDQPAPLPTSGPAIWDLVVRDMRARDAVGLGRYGTRLRAHNGRDALVDLYQELLDAVVYIRQVIAERDDK